MANPKASSRRNYVTELDNDESYLIARITYLTVTLVCKLLIHIFAVPNQNFNLGLSQPVLTYEEYIFSKKKDTI